jgi:UDP-N-acetylmuramate--alanine ligase
VSQLAALGKYRIAVLMGGKSIEREVSFNSGRTVCDHLDSNLYEVIPLFQTEDGQLYILPWHFLHRGKIADFRHRLEGEATHVRWDELKTLIDFVYVAVHGRYAEDGTLQGMLEVLGIPYLGAKVFGSALGMDKVTQKSYLATQGISVPDGFFVSPIDLSLLTVEYLEHAMNNAKLHFPVIVKPAHEGSSLGIRVVKTLPDLAAAIYFAATVNPNLVQDVLVEEKVEGMEFVGVSIEKVNPLNAHERTWTTLPLTEVVHETGTDFFDYEQKYMPGRAAKITPARCDTEQHEAIKHVCEQVARFLQFETIARIDGILAKDGRIVIIDPNSLTGMGPATFLFHQAAEAGYSHAQLINMLIENELLKYGMTGMHPKVTRDGMSDQMPARRRIAVLMGGDSNEREISLESGRNICYKLSPARYEILPVFVSDTLELFKLDQRLLLKNSTREIAKAVTDEMRLAWANLPNIADFVFIGLHGGRGENGSVQGALEMLGLPYNGSGVLTSSLCMNKYATNQFLKSRGFDVPASELVDRATWVALDVGGQKKFIQKQILKNVHGYPVVVKPHDDGCSVMVSRATNDEELCVAIDAMFANHKNVAMVEEFVRGVELTVGVLGNENPIALPPSQAVSQHAVLSMEEKFLPGAGENQTPAPLPKDALSYVQGLVQAAFVALSARGYARIDCFYQSPDVSPTGKDRLVFLEINTLPALTPATCFFHQTAEIGMRPMDFMDKVVEFGFAAKQGKIVEVPDAAAAQENGDIQATLF